MLASLQRMTHSRMMQLPRAPEAVLAEEQAEQANHAQLQREVYNREVQAVTELRRHLRKIVANMVAKSKYADFLYPITPGSNAEAYYKVNPQSTTSAVLSITHLVHAC